jgi:hypothetical protein
MLLEGVVEGEVSITHKRLKGELAMQGDKSSSGDEVQEVVLLRGKCQQLYFTFSADITQRNT